jgi:hypothetical protein
MTVGTSRYRRIDVNQASINKPSHIAQVFRGHVPKQANLSLEPAQSLIVVPMYQKLASYAESVGL